VRHDVLVIEVLQHDYLESEKLPWPDGPSQADLIIADPPYNLGVKYEGDGTCDRLRDDDYRCFVAKAVVQLAQVARPGATLWWICPPEHVDWIGERLAYHFGPREYLIIWYEAFAQYQQKRLTKDYRFIFCHKVSGGQVTFNPDAIRIPSKRQLMGDKRANPRGRVPGQVWNIRRLQGTAKEAVDWHPNQLPPELLERILLGWSNAGDLVVDAFAGTGSMGLQCKAHGRDFIGFDRSATYVQKMKERLG